MLITYKAIACKNSTNFCLESRVIMRVADFFCGGGGFSEGFRQAGFQIVFAVDNWKPAVRTYQGNKPGVNVIQDDVIRISNLQDDEFEGLVPDSEIIIGSPPCQSFSRSNKSGKADKRVGIELIEAFLKIIARKKFKKDSILKYWILENVPNVSAYIKDEYTASDLGLTGNFVIHPHLGASGIYNAKYFGAPTNRVRYLCGEFPTLLQTHNDSSVLTLDDVLNSLGNPESSEERKIVDVNYPELELQSFEVTDHFYVYELAEFEWKNAKRLKQDRGYMGRMSFPENTKKPARTVMATMTASSREAMILSYRNNGFRLPTVREAASMMSFPIDYWFYGLTKAMKHKLVGNAVPPKISYAIAKAIANDSGMCVPDTYIPILHDNDNEFINLNHRIYPKKKERAKREISKFKYHIPYLILSAFRVELTNYHSDFVNKKFIWDVEIHYSQGRNRAAVYVPSISIEQFGSKYRNLIKGYLDLRLNKVPSFNRFQQIYCMTTEEKKQNNEVGPLELLEDIKLFIAENLNEYEQNSSFLIDERPGAYPFGILFGYYILKQLLYTMGGK